MKNFRKIAWILAGYAASFIATLAAFAFASQPANFWNDFWWIAFTFVALAIMSTSMYAAIKLFFSK